jgi:AraC family transcriptional regulator
MNDAVKGGMMSSHIEVTVKKTEPKTVAFVSGKGSFKKIGQTIGKLYGMIQERGYTLAGSPLGVYYSDPQQVPEEELLWEIQWPLGGEVAPVAADERGFGVKSVGAYEAASTVHKGPYDSLSKVYGDMVGWIMANGYEISGPPEEVYMNDPGTTPEEELLTEVRFPVKK